MTRQNQSTSCDFIDDDEVSLQLVLHKPSWQLRVCLVSVLITPLLYRLYLILVTIGYALCLNETSSGPPYYRNCPQVDLSWTGVFPCEVGWRGSVLALAILSAVFLVCYLIITTCLLRWNPRKKLRQIVICSPPVLETPNCQENVQATNFKTLMIMPTLKLSLLLLAFHLLIQSGDVESNPGPINKYDIMVAGGEKIVEALSRDPKGLALSLFAKSLISKAILDETNELNETATDKARRLYTAVLNLIQEYPQHYDDFIGILTEKGELYNGLVHFLKGLLNKAEPFSRRPSIPNVEAYREYLIGIYKVRQLPADAKFPLDCVTHFINLECADIKSQLYRREVEMSWERIMKGQLHSISIDKISISQIACKQLDGFSPNLVLIRGAPGVGKTTLSWELCRRWSTGELWTDYSLVVLIQLRDENIQTASDILDLFQLADAGLPHSAMSDILSTHEQGRGILFILDGFDELPQKFKKDRNSVFTKLVTGYLLPASTVVVTTRPWALSDLPKHCSSRLDQFIEILGFTEEQIQEYVSKMISDKEAPAGLQLYLDANIHISSAMYNPLHARIVVEVYRECFREQNRVLPNTTTELYTAYCRVLIERHLTDYPVEEEWNGDIWKLPQSLQPQFDHLCEIAYQGITSEKQRLVFFSEDIPDARGTLGFMNSVHPFYQSAIKKVSPSYNFIHLTLQEFLAAVFIWRNHTPQEQLILFETNNKYKNGIYKIILLFLAGLTRLGDPWIRCVLPLPEYDEQFSTKVCNFSINSALWLHESQNTELINSYGEVTINVRILPFNSFSKSQQYYIALGYLIGTGNFRVRFNNVYENYTCTTINSVALEIIRHSPCLSRLNCLSLDSYALSNDSVSLLLQSIQPTTGGPGPKLSVTDYHHTNSKAFILSKSSMEFIQSVEELDLFQNTWFMQGMFDATFMSVIIKTLKSRCRLKKLRLTCTNIENIRHNLSDFLMSCQSLEILELTIKEQRFDIQTVIPANCVTFVLNTANIRQLKSRALSLLPSKPFWHDRISLIRGPSYSAQKSNIVMSVQSLTNELESFILERLEVSSINEFFQAIFACSSLRSVTINQFEGATSRNHHLWNISTQSLERLSAHKSLWKLCLPFHPGLTCGIFRALQHNMSVECLEITIDFEADGIADEFGALLAKNRSLEEIQINAISLCTDEAIYGLTENKLSEEIQINSNSPCPDKATFVAIMEYISTASHLKKFGIKCCVYSFDIEISSAICKILKNTSLQFLSIPLFLQQNEKIFETFARVLCQNSTLEILILKQYTKQCPSNPSTLLVSSEEAEALGEMLKVNNSLRIVHLPADFSDCSPIIRGLSVNKSIEEFRISKSAKKEAIKCEDYALARKKIVFVSDYSPFDPERLYSR